MLITARSRRVNNTMSLGVAFKVFYLSVVENLSGMN